MKERIPFDIQFLIESILSEDPDAMRVPRERAREFNSKGAGIYPGVSPEREKELRAMGFANIPFDVKMDWEDKDAIPFYIDVNENVIVFSKNGTHGAMERVLRLAARYIADPVAFEKQGKFFESNVGLPGVKMENVGNFANFPVIVYGLKDNTEEGIKKYIKDNRDRLMKLSIRGGTKVHAIELCGRLWKNKYGISFWNDKSQIDKHLNLVFDFIKALKLNPEKYVYEFIDSKEQMMYGDLDKSVSSINKRTDAEKQELLSKKHFKKDKEEFGPEYWAQHGEKAAKGFDYPAKADAAMPALEGRIKLKDIINESPDSYNITQDDVEKFKKLGIEQEAGKVYWADPPAYPFFIEPKDKIVIYRRGNTHGVIEAFLMYATPKARSESSFALSYEHANMNGDTGFKSKTSENNQCYFHGLKGNDLNTVREYLRKHAEYFNNLEVRGDSQGLEANEIAGRFWKEKNVISFWNDKDDVMPYMKEIFSFMKNLGADIQKSLYEFLDTRGFYTHYELTGEFPDTKEKLSAAEKQEILAQKHMKKDKADYDTRYWDRQGQKAAKGFDYPAKADAAMPALEGRIKLKDLIKESPDAVVSVDGGDSLASYVDEDGVAFFAYSEFSALKENGVHSDIMRKFENVYDHIPVIKRDPEEKQYYKDSLYEDSIDISNFDALVEELAHGKLGTYFRDNVWNENASFRVKSGAVSGRVWTSKKLISFWNDSSFVKKHWNYVEKMFKEQSSILGKLEDYRIDWLERDVRGGGALTPASSLSNGGKVKKDDGQMNFFDKLAGEEPISQEEIRKIQQRLHTMKPKEKKDALMKLGALNTKASEIADKLGMTVAEFNYLMNVNESNNDE